MENEETKVIPSHPLMCAKRVRADEGQIWRKNFLKGVANRLPVRQNAKFRGGGRQKVENLPPAGHSQNWEIEKLDLLVLRHP